MKLSLSHSTWRTYSAAWSSFYTFTLQCGLASLPLSDTVVQLYVTQAASRLRYRTIKVYLAALKFINTYHGFDSSHVWTDQLHYLLRGIRRMQALTFPPTTPRIPITPAHLRLLLQYVRDAHSPADAACFRAAFTLAFFGLLRVSEFTCPGPRLFDAGQHLSTLDIRFSNNPRMMHVRIKVSKTDPFRLGCTIRVASTGNSLCPVNAMRAYLRVRPPILGPLFLFQDGSYLTRSRMQAVLAQTFPFATPGSMGTHSFRIGGASMLCSLGVPDATVQLLGRWSSDAFRRYLHVSDQFLTLIHQRASSCPMSFARIWHPSSGTSKPRDK